MALRALQGPTGGGSPVGGSGTPGTIPVWSSGTTLGNSVITQSGTLIGINTPTPLFTLAVTGRVYAHDAFGTYTNASWRGNFYNAAQGKGVGISYDLSSAGNAIQGLSGAGNGDLVLNQFGGNVGIGTASPGAQLHVERAGGTAANAEYLRLRNTTNATNSNASISFFVSNNVVATGAISHTAASGPSYDTIFSNWNGSTLAEAMRITQGGNVYAASGTTGMTTGFFYIPAAAGAPTGTPTAISGRVPMYYDTTNDQFYIRNGANWRKVTLT